MGAKAPTGLIPSSWSAGRFRLSIHGVVVSFLKDHIFEQRDRIHILQLHLTTLALLANNHTLGLGLEQHTTRGNGIGTTVLDLLNANT